jgi:hypothetical protein
VCACACAAWTRNRLGCLLADADARAVDVYACCRQLRSECAELIGWTVLAIR